MDMLTMSSGSSLCKSSALRLALGVVLASGALSSTTDAAHSAEASSPLAGHWRAAETEDEKAQRLQAIDEATESMGRFRRGRARGRLAERTSPPPSLTIELEGSKVTMGSRDRRLELELGAPPIEVSGEAGKAQLSARMEGARLVVEAQSDNGTRTTTYRADEGRLSMEVSMKGERLARPLDYATTYVRVE
jgi:hypothetical protein